MQTLVQAGLPRRRDTGLNPEPTRLGWEWKLALATNEGRLELEGDQMGSCLAKVAAGHQNKVNIPAIQSFVDKPARLAASPVCLCPCPDPCHTDHD